MLIFLARWFGFKNEILPLWSFFLGGGRVEQALRREMRKEKNK